MVLISHLEPRPASILDSVERYPLQRTISADIHWAGAGASIDKKCSSPASCHNSVAEFQFWEDRLDGFGSRGNSIFVMHPPGIRQTMVLSSPHVCSQHLSRPCTAYWYLWSSWATERVSKLSGKWIMPRLAEEKSELVRGQPFSLFLSGRALRKK